MRSDLIICTNQDLLTDDWHPHTKSIYYPVVKDVVLDVTAATDYSNVLDTIHYKTNDSFYDWTVGYIHRDYKNDLRFLAHRYHIKPYVLKFARRLSDAIQDRLDLLDTIASPYADVSPIETIHELRDWYCDYYSNLYFAINNTTIASEYQIARTIFDTTILPTIHWNPTATELTNKKLELQSELPSI